MTLVIYLRSSYQQAMATTRLTTLAGTHSILLLPLLAEGACRTAHTVMVAIMFIRKPMAEVVLRFAP